MKIYIGGYPRREILEWNEKYQNLGSLYSPGQVISPKISFCLDNGAFINFNPRKFIHHLEKGVSIRKPDFIVCPDAVGNWSETLQRWKEWEPCLREFKCPIAFPVQDDQPPNLIPPSADLLFLGGSTRYKLASMKFWCSRFPTHVGRVNTWGRLWQCAIVGAISCDGTGWFRKTANHWSAQDLLLFLKIMKGEIKPINHLAWPFISLLARKSLLKKEWELIDEPLFYHENR